MFQSLRGNNQFYILHKESVPYVEVGSIVSVSAPYPKFTMNMNFGQPQEMVVDIVAKVKDNNMNFQKLPATSDIADFGMGGNIVLATSKDAINEELISLKKKSQDIINSKDFHLSVIEGCDAALKDLNPEYAQKQAQQEEIDSLKSQMGQMAKSMNELMQMNKELLSKFDETPKKKQS